MSYLDNHKGLGGYSLIGQNPQELFEGKQEQIGADWLYSKQVEYCSRYSTDLKAMSEYDFDLISKHGYESATAINIVRNSIR
ncbi:hypothetical protein AADZ91_13045 [Colwelliaceae bacterium 6441]